MRAHLRRVLLTTTALVAVSLAAADLPGAIPHARADGGQGGASNVSGTAGGAGGTGYMGGAGQDGGLANPSFQNGGTGGGGGGAGGGAGGDGGGANTANGGFGAAGGGAPGASGGNAADVTSANGVPNPNGAGGGGGGAHGLVTNDPLVNGGTIQGGTGGNGGDAVVSSGGGGGGGAGGYGVVVNASGQSSNSGMLLGGTGGNGGGSSEGGALNKLPGAGGGDGGYGALFIAAGAAFTNSNTVLGGNGGNGGGDSVGGGGLGNGGKGGVGGTGLGFGATFSLTNDAGAMIRGGTGGPGGGGGSDGERDGGNGLNGNGGVGGVGLTGTGGFVMNAGTISGGNGGAPGAGGNEAGTGGAGGIGVSVGSTNVTNQMGGAITGGNGANGGANPASPNGGGAINQNGGAGAAGISAVGGSIFNAGMITGGSGGAVGTGGTGGTAGVGGYGITGSNLVVVNSGTISGGLANAGAAGAAQADAIAFTGGASSLTLSANGTTGTLNGAIAVGGTLAIDPGTAAGGNVTLANQITDYTVASASGTTTTTPGTLVKVGAGTLTLSAANTYSGGTTITGGTLVANSVDGTGNINALGGGTVTLNGGTLSIAQGTALFNAISVGTAGGTFAGTSTNVEGQISGSGPLTFDGNVRLDADNSTFSGTTIVTSGATLLGVGSNSLSPNSAFQVAAGGTLNLNSGAQTIGSLADSGNGGGTVTQGALSTGNDNTSTRFSGTITDFGNGTSPTSLTKVGTGTFTLAGTNTYSGATAVNAGTLNLTGSLGNTAMTVASGATFAGAAGTTAGTGTTGGTVTIQAGGFLSPGDATVANSVGTLTMAGLTLSAPTADRPAGSTYAVDLGAPNVVGGTTNDLVVDNGALTLAGTVAVSQAAGFGPGAYRLVNYTGALTNDGVALTGAPTGSIVQAGGGQVNLLVAGANGIPQYWNGATITPNGMVNGGNGSWTNAPANTNWTDANGNFAENWASGAGIFAGAAGTVTVNDAISFQALEFQTTGYTVAPGTGTLTATGAATITTDANVTATISASIGGSAGLTKAGSGALVLSGTNTYSGGTTINAGTLSVDADANLGAAPTMANPNSLTFAGGTLETTASFTSTRGVTLNTAGTIQTDTGVTTTLGGVIADGTGPGSLTKTGTGALVLSGTNTYSGGTTISGGTLALAGTGSIASSSGVALASTGIFDISGLTNGGTSIISLGDTAPGQAGTVALGANTLTLTNASGTFSGTLGNVGDTGGFTVTAGTETLSGVTANYSGTTDIGAATGPTATLALTNGTGLGGSIVDVATTGTLDLSNAGANVPVGSLAGSGAVTTGSSTYGLVVLDGSTTFGGTISGAGGVEIAGGTQTFSGVNTYTNATSIDPGATLALSGNGSIATSLYVATLGTLDIAQTTAGATVQGLYDPTGNGRVNLGSQTLTIADGVDTFFDGQINGAGGLTLTSGSQTLAGANGYTGATTISGGTLALSGAGSIAASSGVADNGTFDISATSAGASIKTLSGAGTVALGGETLTITAGSTTFAGQINGSGGLSLAAGTLTLSGANSYTGATAVSAGTLNLTGSLGATAMTVASGATFAGTGTSAGSVTIAAGGTIAPGLPGAGNIGTLTMAGLTLSAPTAPAPAGSTYAVDLGQANTVGGAANDRIQDNGQLTLAGTAAVNPGQNFGSGAYRLIDYTGALTNEGLAVTGLPAGYTYQVQTAIPSQVNLVAIGPGGVAQYWDGAQMTANGTIAGGSGTWNATNGNWTSPNGTFNAQWASSIGIFAGSAGTVTLADNEAFQTLQFSTTGYVVTPANGATLTPGAAAVLRADPGVTATIAAPLIGTGSLTLTGVGTIVLTGASTYSGGTTISAGTLQLGNGGAAGSIAGNVVDNASLAFDRSDVSTFAGAIAGSGAVNQIGTGTTVLTGADTYAGGTTIAAGTLQLGAGGTAGSITGNVADNGTLAFDRADAVTFAGTIAGSGAVAQVGSGSTTLTAANTYAGGTTIAAGTVVVANNAALGTGTLAMAPGTTLGFAGGANYAVANNVTLSGDPTVSTPGGQTDTLSGTIADGTAPGVLDKAGAGTLVLTGADTYSGGTIVSAGTLQLGNGGAAGSIVGNVTDNATLAFDRSNAVTFAGAISGSGAVQQIGTGTTTLTGTSSYTGATSIASGALVVDGSIATSSGVTVAQGAALAGSGTVSSLQVAGTLAPGAGTMGTLNVAGNVAFAPGSLYAVAVTPATSSRTSATGGASLAGTVLATFLPGSYLAKQYTILSAAGGVNGAFGALATRDLPTGFTASLATDADDAYLDLASTSMTHQLGLGGLNMNQLAVGRALNTYFDNGGALPPGFVGVFGLKGPSLARTLSTLSGEGITGAQNVADRSSELFTSTITDQTVFYGDASGTANSVTLTEAPPGFLGLAPAAGAAPVRELADLPAAAQPVAPVAPVRTWRAWATGFGGVEDIQGNAVVGSNRQDNTIVGGSLGVDRQLTPSLLVGVAVGGSDGTFQVPTLGTSGSSTGGHVALYALATEGPLYGEASTAFSAFTNHTYRSGLAGTERGDFSSYEFRQRFEIGRHVAVAGGTVTPFVALEVAELHADGFRETSLTGANTYALDVQGQDQTSVPAFLGARWQQHAALGNGLVFTPSLQVAYVHEFSPLRTLTASFASLPGSVFLVDGARPDYNAAQLKVGGELALSASSALFASFDGELSGHDQLYAGKGGFKFVW